ncbi:MAG TPA: flavodoxin [Candidatus Negativibacillus faecipullorum]|nr:flavodoxin [Candidatus Negativibacillus faecipullorum]
MSKVAVIYWSGTGNTQQMADAVAEGAKGAGAEVSVFSVSEISADAAAAYDHLALGCPAMGGEVLEESEFEPFFSELEGSLSGKKVVLFGSYDWGDGQWMRDWQQRTVQAGAQMPADGLIVNLTPDEDGLAQCRELGAKIAE